MEHKQATKAYANILKLLPKSSLVNFQNPLHSPSREKRSDQHHHHHQQNKHKSGAGQMGAAKGYSGPVMSMPLVPAEARRNMKNNKLDGSLAYREPTSPKISCMGQIKHKHKKQFDKAKSFSIVASTIIHKQENNSTSKATSKSIDSDTNNKESKAPKKHHHHPSMLKRMFTMSKRPPPAAHQSRKSFHQIERAPGLSQLKRFASGRDTFASFDWTTADLQHQMDRAPETDRGTYTFTCQQQYHHHDHHDEDEDEDDFIIPFSAPIAVVKGVVALQPRKEVNLWKRRTLNPPAPLQLN